MMKTKLILLLICVSAFTMSNVNAQESGTIKQRLTNHYFNFIKSEGYLPSIDEDGDIMFKFEGRVHYLVVNDEEDPQFLVLSTIGYSVDEEDKTDELKCIVAANNTNKSIRSVKALVSDGIIYFQIEIPVVSYSSFEGMFGTLLSYLSGGRSAFLEEYDSLDVDEDDGEDLYYDWLQTL